MKNHSTMSTWKSKIIRKKGKRSATTAGRAKTYALLPPDTGWTGGNPEQVNALGKKAPL